MGSPSSPELIPFNYVLTDQITADEVTGQVLDPVQEERRLLETQDFARWEEEIDLTFVQSAPEWEYLIDENAEVSPEALRQGQQALDLKQVSKDALARHALSAKGPEAWRTAAALDCLPVLCRGDEAGLQWFRSRTLPGEQPKTGELTEAQYRHFSEETQEIIGDQTTFLSMQVTMLYHDLGKSSIFKQRAIEAGVDVAGKDHDAIMREVMERPELHARLLPTLERLKQVSREAYDMTVEVLSVDANYGQLLQGEAPAQMVAQLEGLSPKVLKLWNLHAKLDIAGVMGQKQHAGTTVIDAEVYQDMQDLEWALTTDSLSNPISRYNAYLRRRGARLGLDFDTLPPAEWDKGYTLVRLATMQRMHEPENFDRLAADFEAEPAVVQSILVNQLNRNGLTDKAILHGYSPSTLRALVGHELLSSNYLSIFALLLHEAELFDHHKGANDVRVTMSDLRQLAVEINKRSYDIGSDIRFHAQESRQGDRMLVPDSVRLSLDNLDELPEFADGELLRGKRVLMVGMAGGADNLHARALGDLIGKKYGADLTGVLGIRKKERILKGETMFGTSVLRIKPGSTPHGTWRVTEEGLLRGENPPEAFMLNATDYDTLSAHIKAFCREAGVDVVIGVDPGGDSLSYKNNYEGLPRHLATVQDHTVIEVLADLGIPAFTAVTSPGLYSRAHAREILHAAEGSLLPLTGEDREGMLDLYAQMGTTSSDEANYSTTAMIFEKASNNQFGLQSIDLPPYVVISEENPWRVFHHVTPAMKEIAIMETRKLASAIRRKPR